MHASTRHVNKSVLVQSVSAVHCVGANDGLGESDGLELGDTDDSADGPSLGAVLVVGSDDGADEVEGLELGDAVGSSGHLYSRFMSFVCTRKG